MEEERKRKITNTQKCGTTPEERPKQRYCRCCDAPNCNLNHKNPVRESISHDCKKKEHFPKACKIVHRKWQEIEKITEPEETEEADTDKSIHSITEIKHITDQRNQIIMTKIWRNRKGILSWHGIAGCNNTTWKRNNERQDFFTDNRKTPTRKKERR